MPAAIPLSTAAVLYGMQDLRIEHRPQHLPPRGYAQVRIMATTLCGSDCTLAFDPIHRPSLSQILILLDPPSALLLAGCKRNLCAPTLDVFGP